MSWQLERPDKHGDMYVDTKGSLQDCLGEMFYLIDHPNTEDAFKLVLTYTRDVDVDHG